MKSKFIVYFVSFLLAVEPCSSHAADFDTVVFSEPQRILRRIPESVPISPLKEPTQTLFLICDSESGDAKTPYRNLVSRIKYAFSSLEGHAFAFIPGGLELQKALITAAAFAEPITYTTRQTNIVSTAEGPIPQVLLTTNDALARYSLTYRTLPHYTIDVQIIDGTEEPSKVKSGRVFGSFLIGNFLDAVTLETTFNWRRSVAHIHTIASIYDFRSGVCRAQGSARTDIIKRSRGGSFAVRYSSRAALSYDGDNTTAVTFEAALTEGVTLAFARALEDLYGLPETKVDGQLENSGGNRTAMERSWVIATPEARQRALRQYNTLAAECGLPKESFFSELGASHWRELLESPALQLRNEPFDKHPLAKVPPTECRLVFEGFPSRKWCMLHKVVADLLSHCPHAAVVSDNLEPEIAFRLRRSIYLFRPPFDSAEIRDFVANSLHKLTGNTVDSQVVGRTVYFKFRPSLPSL